MRVGADLGPYNAGPLWIWNDMHYNNKTDAQGKPYVEVQAPMMKTPVDYIVPLAAGYHYCKVLSPARVMEWVYVDGLRDQLHI